MLCPQCNNQIPDDSVFCPMCGNMNFTAHEAEQTAFEPGYTQPLVQPQDETGYTQPLVQPAPSQAYQNGYQQSETPQAYPTQAYQPQYAPVSPQPKKNTSFIVIAALGGVAVIAIILAILFGTGVLGGKDDDSNDNLNGYEQEENTEKNEPSGFEINITDPTEETTKHVETTAKNDGVPAVGSVLNTPHITPDKKVNKVHYDFTLDEIAFDVIVDVSVSGEQLVYITDFELEDGYCDVLLVKHSDGSWSEYAAYEGNYIEFSRENQGENELELAQMFLDLCGFGLDQKTNILLKGPYTYNGMKKYSDYGMVYSYSCTFDNIECEIYIDPQTGLIIRLEDTADGIIKLDYKAYGNSVKYNDFRSKAELY